MRRTLLLALLIAALLAGALGLYFANAFALTGEEDFGAQAAALPLLIQNLAYARPRTEPFAVVEHTSVNPYGINTFLHQEVEPAKREAQMRLIHEAGFHWLRQEFPWQDIEIHGRGDFIDRRNDPAGIDAWAKYDQIVDLAGQYDLEIIARLSSPPAWSRAEPEDVTGPFAPPDDYADYARFAAVVAERYRGRIRYYQLWNEPNIYPEWGNYPVSPEDYTRLLCEAYRAIRAADPDAVILSGALAPTSEIQPQGLNDFLFLERMYAAGAAGCFDILSAQGYGLWSGPTDRRMRPLIINYGRSQYLRDIMVRHGDAHKPIWISEMNWNAAPEDVEPRYGRVTLEQQARFAPLAYQRAQRDWPWVGVVAFWYFKRADDQWLAERRPEAYFQMAEPDFTLLPVYESMRAHTALPPVLYRGTHGADHWAVAYGAGWTVGREGASAGEGAEPATFTFEGTQLQIVFGPAGGRPDSAIRLQVDGRRPIEPAPHTGGTIWLGGPGRHTAVITPRGDVTLEYLVVRRSVPAVPAAIASAVLVLAGAAFAASRRLED